MWVESLMHHVICVTIRIPLSKYFSCLTWVLGIEFTSQCRAANTLPSGHFIGPVNVYIVTWFLW